MADANTVINRLGEHIGQITVQLMIARVELENSASVEVVDELPDEEK